MNKYIVTADKLNIRSAMPVAFPDKDSIIGTVKKGVVFEADEVMTVPNPSLGKWYRDRNDHFFWGGGVALVATAGAQTGMPPSAIAGPASGADITPALLQQIFPAADPARLREIAAAFNLGYAVFSLDTNLRRAHFFAQMLEEVGTSASTKSENMNYAAEKLGGLFSYFRSHPAEAEQFGRTAHHSADQEAIANRAYANRNGNGDVASGDGWRFRGKGFIQLTGRNNYSSIQRHINSMLPDCGIDVIGNEEDILTVKGAMLSAMAFFSKNNIHFISDAGTADAVVDRVTTVINKDTPSRAKRIAHFHEMKRIFGLA